MFSSGVQGMRTKAAKAALLSSPPRLLIVLSQILQFVQPGQRRLKALIDNLNADFYYHADLSSFQSPTLVAGTLKAVKKETPTTYCTRLLDLGDNSGTSSTYLQPPTCQAHAPVIVGASSLYRYICTSFAFKVVFDTVPAGNINTFA